MDVIRKKICLEPLRSRVQGLLKYISIESGTTIMPEANAINGNWGGIVMNFSSGNTTYNYLKLMNNYNAIYKILLSGKKYKVVKEENNNANFITDFDEYVRLYDFEPISYQNIADKIYSGTSRYVVEIEDIDNFNNLGGLSFLEYMNDNIIGKLRVPSNIEGERVPSFVYYCEIKDYYDWLKENRDSKDCCVKKMWESRGGMDMLLFLRENLNLHSRKINEAKSFTYSTPYMNIPLFLTQTIDDFGVMTEYIDTENLGCIDENGNKINTTSESVFTEFAEGVIKAESELYTLESDERHYDDYGEKLPGILQEATYKYWEKSGTTIKRVSESEVTGTSYSVLDLSSSLSGADDGYYLIKYQNSYDMPMTIPYTVHKPFNSQAIYEMNENTGEMEQKKEGDLYCFRGDMIMGISISSNTTPNKIKFTYALGIEYLMAKNTTGSGFTFSTYNTGTGIYYAETYNYYPKASDTFTINGVQTTLYYNNIDFDSAKQIVENDETEDDRTVLLSNIIGIRLGDVWQSKTSSSNITFKDDSIMGVNLPEKDSVNVEVNRGDGAAIEKRFKFSECNSYEDLKNYGNNYFGI